MATKLHSNVLAGSRHPIHQLEYPTQADRIAGTNEITGATPKDYDVAKVNSDDSLWLLTDAGTLAWSQIVTSSSTSTFGDDVDLLFGDTADAAIQYDTTQTPDSWLFGVPATSNALIICEKADMGVDFGHGLQTNPTLFVQSADSGSPSQWIGLSHNQTDGVISVGTGAVSIPSALDVIGRISCLNSISVNDQRNIILGSSEDVLLRFSTDQTVNSFLIAVPSAGRDVLICEIPDRAVDFGHSLSANPRVVIQSSDATDVTQYIALSHNQTDAVIESGKGGLIIPEYTRHFDVMPSSALLGPTAPTVDVQDTFAGLGFDADAEAAYLDIEVPDEWVGISDMTLEVVWMPESGDAIADTETVKWDISYRSIADGEAVDNGTVATATATYTQSGAGTDKELIKTEITLDYDGANQPLTIGDTLGIKFDRDVTGDTYSGKAIVVRWELYYTANRPGTH